jgi:octaprenyl-diphosphate synthase
MVSQLDFDPARAAKRMLAESLEPVEARLRILDGHLPHYIPTESQTSKDVLAHVFQSGGKRIRPALYFFCCDLLDYKAEHLYPIAAVCEYVHTASLLHDDVVDSSTLRRNKPTANSIWGDQASVLVGDLIYSRASEMMAATGSLDIVKSFARAIRIMSEGELLQLEAAFNPDASEETYMKVVYCKTAALIATSCKAAAILAGIGNAAEDKLYQFGKNLGLAFQLIDDALDYIGNREFFGKPTLSDLKEGKVSLPVILLAKLANDDDRATLRAIINKKQILDEDVAVVAKLVETYDTAELTIERANAFTDQAISCLDGFPDSVYKDRLISVAKRLVGRFN